MDNTQTTPSPAYAKHGVVAGLVWWTTLVMAVIAVPLIGGIVAMAITKSASMQMIIFMLTCWVSTWLGMWLMKKSQTHHLEWHHKQRQQQ